MKRQLFAFGTLTLILLLILLGCSSKPGDKKESSTIAPAATSQEQAVASVVDGYFTQTAEVQNQAAATQIVQAAFEQALTGTAGFQATVNAQFESALTATVAPTATFLSELTATAEAEKQTLAFQATATEISIKNATATQEQIDFYSTGTQSVFNTGTAVANANATATQEQIDFYATGTQSVFNTLTAIANTNATATQEQINSHATATQAQIDHYATGTQSVFNTLTAVANANATATQAPLSTAGALANTSTQTVRSDTEGNPKFQVGDIVIAQENARIWNMPDASDPNSHRFSIPQGTLLVITSTEIWGPILWDGSVSGYWYQVRYSEELSAIGWIWEERLAD